MDSRICMDLGTEISRRVQAHVKRLAPQAKEVGVRFGREDVVKLLLEFGLDQVESIEDFEEWAARKGVVL
ncbi:MAG: hypothetical protein JKY65_16770 [Planctomycetes bacterium]|nr:hypothetical protein [Planctomycetota bacterium]